MSSMTPQEIVSELDNHIVGQASAKRAVAIALRNRWRRGSSSTADLNQPKRRSPLSRTGSRSPSGCSLWRQRKVDRSDNLPTNY